MRITPSVCGVRGGDGGCGYSLAGELRGCWCPRRGCAPGAALRPRPMGTGAGGPSGVQGLRALPRGGTRQREENSPAPRKLRIPTGNRVRSRGEPSGWGLRCRRRAVGGVGGARRGAGHRGGAPSTGSAGGRGGAAKPEGPPPAARCPPPAARCPPPAAPLPKEGNVAVQKRRAAAPPPPQPPAAPRGAERTAAAPSPPPLPRVPPPPAAAAPSRYRQFGPAAPSPLSPGPAGRRAPIGAVGGRRRLRRRFYSEHPPPGGAAGGGRGVGGGPREPPGSSGPVPSGAVGVRSKHRDEQGQPWEHPPPPLPPRRTNAPGRLCAGDGIPGTAKRRPWGSGHGWWENRDFYKWINPVFASLRRATQGPCATARLPGSAPRRAGRWGWVQAGRWGCEG